MRKLLVVAFCLLAFESAVVAEKVDTKWHCSKPSSDPSLEVGDVAGHNYALAQGTCSATSSGSGKHKGIKGSGTCSGMRNDDGSSDWGCTGTTMMGK